MRVLGIPRYTAGGLDVVAFDWGLRQAFPKRPIEGITPVASPGMGGGLFAIDRKLFFKLGGEYASAWCRAYAWQCGMVQSVCMVVRHGAEHMHGTASQWC